MVPIDPVTIAFIGVLLGICARTALPYLRKARAERLEWSHRYTASAVATSILCLIVAALTFPAFTVPEDFFSPCVACCVRVGFGVDSAVIEGCGMDFPEEDRTVEHEEKLQFDDMNEALVYIAEKMGTIEEVGKATQQEIVLLRKDFLKFMKYIIALAILAICALAGVRLILS